MPSHEKKTNGHVIQSDPCIVTSQSRDKTVHNENTREENGDIPRQNPVDGEDEALAQLAPDGGYGWVIVAACFVLQAMLDGTFSIVGVFLPEFVDYFSGGRAQVAVIGSVMGGCVMLSGPFVSALVNCFGCRPVSVVGGIVITCGVLAAALAPSVQVLVATLGALTGVGLGMQFVPSIVIVGYYFTRRRALATGIATGGSGVGVLLMAPLAAFLLKNYDWRSALVMMAGVILHSVIASALLRPLVVAGPSRSTSIDTDTAAEPTSNAVKDIDKKNANNEKVKGAQSHTLLRTALLNSAATETQNGDIHKVKGVESANRHSGNESQANGTVSGDSNHLVLLKNAQSHDFSAAHNLSGSQSVNTYRKFNGNNAPHLHKPKNENQRKSSSECYYSNYEISDPSAGEQLLKHEHRKHRVVANRAANSPLRRKDIFYAGSITSLAEYRSQPDVQHYISSVTIPAKDTESENSAYCCKCIPRSNLETTRRMLDCSLLANGALLAIAAGNACWQAGYMIPLIFVTDYGISNGMDPQVSSLFVSVFGVTMIFGRMLGGAIGNLPRVNPLYVIVSAQLLAGLASCAVPFCSSVPLLMLCIGTIGFMLGPVTPLTTVCIVDYLGLSKLTSAVGLVSMSKGILCFFGAPIAGALLDATGSYIAPFGFAGLLYILCGLAFVLLPFVGTRLH